MADTPEYDCRYASRYADVSCRHAADDVTPRLTLRAPEETHITTHAASHARRLRCFMTLMR